MKFLLISLLLQTMVTPGAAGAGEQFHTEKDTLKIVLISDLNESYGSTHYGDYVDSTLAFIENERPDLVLCTGDMVAGQSLNLSEEKLHEMWRGFDLSIGQPLRDMGIPFAFTLGNHDGSGSGNFEHERQIAKEYWNTRKPNLPYISAEHFPFYYSFVFDDLFIISWDATNHNISDPELRWVRNQLNQPEAKEASVRLMLGHLPLYAVADGRNHEGEVLSAADDRFNLMSDGNVNYYFSGHHHAWFAAVKENMKLIHSGAQGGGPRQLIGLDSPARRTVTLLKKPEGESTFQITTLDLENEMKPLLPEELPQFIEGFNGTLHRYEYR